MNPWLKRALIAGPVLVAAFFGAILLYVNVIRDDAPPELSTEELAAAVSGTGGATTIAETTAAKSTVAATTTAAPTIGAPTTAAAAAGFDGTWTVTADSEFGYRVEEVLFGVNATAAGRSNSITGDLTVTGTSVTEAAFTVDVASIVSDDERRDTQFRGRIMDTATFPEASFVLTTPIELGAAPASGEQLTASATGNLTLRGVTKTVTFDVTAEAGAGRFGVFGNIPVLFADYGIDNPSRNGITTEDHGLLEFILVFEPVS